jgi:hypothetical protein
MGPLFCFQEKISFAGNIPFAEPIHNCSLSKMVKICFPAWNPVTVAIKSISKIGNLW